MKLSEKIFKVSGVEYATNSNIYAVKTTEGIVLIDCGFQEDQWNKTMKAMELSGLGDEKITHCFITHSHFDHAGNIQRVNDLGIKTYASAIDKEKIENGNPEMEALFQTAWTCGKVNEVIAEGDEFVFGDVKIIVIETPGHSSGSLSFIIEAPEIKALCSADLFFVSPLPPLDTVTVELGYLGSEDFDIDDMIKSLNKMAELKIDLLLPGHYYSYFGDPSSLCMKAHEYATEIKEGEKEHV